jgi:sigma-B regulation protein RsbU (phosphoserine phosphatase)
MRKKRHSLRRPLFIRTAIWATVAFAVALLVSVFASIRYNEQKSFEIAYSSSKQAAAIIQTAFAEIDLPTVARQRDTDAYRAMRDELRRICLDFGFDYLYLYEVNAGKQERRYLTVVAYENETDDIVKDLNPSTVVDYPQLCEQEKSALKDYPDPSPYALDNNHGKVYSWFFPYKDGQGKIVALIGCDYNLQELTDGINNSSIILAFIMGVQTVLVIGIMLYKLRVQILKPLNAITLHISSFVDVANAHDYVNQVEPLAYKSGDEIQQIADAFDTMSADLTKNVQRNQRLRDERVAARTELEVARRIQDGLVPEEKQLEGVGYEGFAFAHSARSVGGDFYDIFELPDGRVAAVMGDVSGKGVSAALFMAMARTIIHETLCHDITPAAALTNANESICAQNPMVLFVTAFACVLDPQTGELIYANAGHTHPVLFGKSCSFLRPDPGMALGLFEDSDVASSSLTLTPGEGILLYTDGVTEATNKDKSFFGEQRLLDALRDVHDAEDAITCVHHAVSGFVADGEQFDDLTMLALVRTSENGLVLEATQASFVTIRDRLHDELGSGQEFKRVLLSVDEAFANVISHAQATQVTFECAWHGDTFELTLGDNGIPFNPLDTPREEKEFEDLEFGGMGIGLILSVADDAGYERKDGHNLLTLRFTHLKKG